MRYCSRGRFSLLAVTPNTAMSSMSSRPSFRGRSSNRSGFSDLSNHRGRGRGRQIATGGDSHFHSGHDQNLGFRQGSFENRAGFHSQPFNPIAPADYRRCQFRYPPPHIQNQNFMQPQFRQFRSPPPPPPQFGGNGAFQPPQHRPRPRKPVDFRNWEYAKTAPHNSERFIVLSYNILADYLAIDHRSKLYFHIPRYMLDWQWRKRSIMFELGLWSADIMCLQEVDRFHDLEEELKHRGYCGIWKMRTGNPVDGCATFWRTSRFKLVHEESIEFNKLGLRDNVAQICVLELTSKKNTKGRAAQSPTSSKDSNKVVVCNIHVLYNPKRGEIKLGQVRALLHRAHAVSKQWGDAPLVLCGDFNCTPKSPMYNYILEQKIDLSQVHRDKVSGQASAEIRPYRQYNRNPGDQSADHSIQPPLTLEGREVGIDTTNSLAVGIDTTNSLADREKHNENISSGNLSQCQYDAKTMLNASSGSLIDGLCDNEKTVPCDEVKQETPQNVVDNIKVDKVNKEVQKCTPTVSPHAEDEDALVSRLNHGSSNIAECGTNCTNARIDTDSLNSLISSFDPLCKSETVYSTEVYSHSSDIIRSQSKGDSEQDCSSYQVDVCDETFESSSPDEQHGDMTEGENIEDDQAFLSALHGNEDVQLQSPSSEVLNDFSSGLGSETISNYRPFYDPSVWTPIEIETATGKPDCTVLEHPIKLRSTYTEVQDSSGTRDSSGEPMVTSYNRCFLGTVDYIWCSEGLQTVRVLAPIPKHAMQQTPGFPTKKWGSDHIALASELVFTKGVNN